MYPRRSIALLSLMMTVWGPPVALGQDFPSKPIHILAGSAGGATDFTARLIGQEISGPLGQQVVVENRPSTVIPETVSKAVPDGSTLTLLGSVLWIGPLLQKTSYDPVRDFSPISLVMNFPSIVVVHPSLPVKSIKELIALAKAKPGALNYGSGGFGGATHLGVELFKSMANVSIVRITYNGAASAVNALMAGETQLMITDAVYYAQVKSGRLRALAVTSAQPSQLFPGVPTVSASGLPAFDYASSYGLFGPAKTPTAIITRLNLEVVRALNKADVKARLTSSLGADVVGSSPAQLAAQIKSEMGIMGKVIRDAGIKAE